MRSWTLRTAASFGALSLLASAAARAEPAGHPRTTAVLDLRVDEGAEGCPAATELRTKIAERLGYDPFDPAAPQTVTGRLRREKGRFIATVALRSADGSVHARTPLVSATKDCRDIADSFALAISIAIDPMSLTRPRSEPPTETEVESPSAPPQPASLDAGSSEPSKPESPRSPPQEGVEFRGGGGIVGSIGAVPHPSFAPMLFAGASLGRAAMHVEARYDLPASADGPAGGQVIGSLLLGSLVPCFEALPVFLCGVGSVGVLFGEGSGVLVVRSRRTTYAGLGLRAGVEVRFNDAMRGRIQLDGFAPIQPTSLSVLGERVWSTPVVVGSLGAVILFR